MTTPPKPPRLAKAIVAAACLALAACSPSTPLSPSPTPSAPPTASAAPTNAPSPAPTTPLAGVVPAGFAPNSVSFVSASVGWVLGDTACGATACLALFRTSDGGHTWVAAPAPPADFSWSTFPQLYDGRTGVSQVRFSDTQDGWAFDPDLWSTHDGGAHWARSNLGIVSSLEAANGAVHAVADDMSNTMSIKSSPTTRDAWTPTGSLQLGAGPVPFASLVLHGAAGWAVENDRTVVDGARLVSGHWQSWHAPCSTTGGQAVLGAATASALVAVCQQGNWDTAIPPAVRAYFSNDGGATFHSTGPALGGDSSLSGGVVASPAAGVVLTDRRAGTGADDLIESVDSGASWQTVATAPASMSFTYLGFTTQSQGVAIAEGEGASALMLMTYDGGRHWSPVSF